MAKTWSMVLEGGDGKDISLTGIDAIDIIGAGTLNSRYIANLKWNITNKPHYKAIGRVKSLESSTGEKPDVNSVGVILATAASEEVEMGIIVIKTVKGRLQVLALWPDAFASACKNKKERYTRFIVSLVQVPAFFGKVSIILPKP